MFENDFFKVDLNSRKSKFSIIISFSNVLSLLHIGYIFNKILHDIVYYYK